MKSAHEILNEELNLRKMKNSGYSLRAFARDLNISVTALSDFLTRKRNLSKTNLLKICHSLNLPPLERENILHHKMSKTNTQNLQIQDDSFRLFSDWYCFAILNLPRVKHHQINIEWISNQFGITDQQAKDAIARLTRLNLIRIKNGKFIRTRKNILSSYSIPDLAIKKHHQKLLQMSEIALLEVDQEKRDFSTTILSLNSKNLDSIKRHLQKIKSKAAKKIEDKNSNDFYCLTLQLFPLKK